MKIIYRIDMDGKAQLQNDEDGTSLAMSRAAKRLGYVVTEFSLELEREVVEVVALSPDTLLASQRRDLVRLIQKKYALLKEIKRIIL